MLACTVICVVLGYTTTVNGAPSSEIVPDTTSCTVTVSFGNAFYKQFSVVSYDVHAEKAFSESINGLRYSYCSDSAETLHPDVVTQVVEDFLQENIQIDDIEGTDPYLKHDFWVDIEIACGDRVGHMEFLLRDQFDDTLKTHAGKAMYNLITATYEQVCESKAVFDRPKYKGVLDFDAKEQDFFVVSDARKNFRSIESLRFQNSVSEGLLFHVVRDSLTYLANSDTVFISKWYLGSKSSASVGDVYYCLYNRDSASASTYTILHVPIGLVLPAKLYDFGMLGVVTRNTLLHYEPQPSSSVDSIDRQKSEIAAATFCDIIERVGERADGFWFLVGMHEPSNEEDGGVVRRVGWIQGSSLREYDFYTEYRDILRRK